MQEQPMSRQQRREAARRAAKQAERAEPAAAPVPETGNGDGPPAVVTMPVALAPKFQPSKVDTQFNVESVYDGTGAEWKLLVCSTPLGVAWYFIPLHVAEQLAEWLKGTAPNPASKLIIPGVSVRPDMFKGTG